MFSLKQYVTMTMLKPKLSHVNVELVNKIIACYADAKQSALEIGTSLFFFVFFSSW